VVHVVLDAASPAGQPVVRHEGEIVADVRVNADDDAELHEAPGGHRVVVEEPG